MRKKFAVLDHQIDAGDIHVHDATGTDIQMSNFTVAHLPFGQAHKRTASVNQRIGIFAKESIVRRLPSESDGVSFGFGPIPPAVENDENERFRTRHKSVVSS